MRAAQRPQGGVMTPQRAQELQTPKTLAYNGAVSAHTPGCLRYLTPRPCRADVLLHCSGDSGVGRLSVQGHSSPLLEAGDSTDVDLTVGRASCPALVHRCCVYAPCVCAGAECVHECRVDNCVPVGRVCWVHVLCKRVSCVCTSVPVCGVQCHRPGGSTGVLVLGWVGLARSAKPEDARFSPGCCPSLPAPGCRDCLASPSPCLPSQFLLASFFSLRAKDLGIRWSQDLTGLWCIQKTEKAREEKQEGLGLERARAGIYETELLPQFPACGLPVSADPLLAIFICFFEDARGAMQADSPGCCRSPPALPSSLPVVLGECRSRGGGGSR